MAKSGPSLPPPSGPLNATLISWGSGRQLHRVHDAGYPANSFNPSPRGNARFSPIYDTSSGIIPTLYAGTTEDCALMETVFHDVPFKAGFKPLSLSKMTGKVHSRLILKSDLLLVDLSTIALRKLGLKRVQLIDTTKAHYPQTRKWAEALYAAFADAQGLRWTSRQDDQANAILLFGTRVSSSHLAIDSPSTPALVEGIASAAIINLAIRLGVTLVD
jgi:hypothetical protein